jgi:hypothetical protein
MSCLSKIGSGRGPDPVGVIEEFSFDWQEYNKKQRRRQGVRADRS